MKPYLYDTSEVLNAVKASEQGLQSEEAAARLEKNGKNKLAEGKKISIFRRFLGELADPMIIILLIAAAISAVTSIFANESFADVIIILAVVIINAVLGVIQESKAEKAIEALQQITAATSKVIRNGEQTVVKSEDLVVGDIIVLEAGDSVPADSRILECHSMKVEEAALTGESVPVGKIDETITVPENVDDVALGDRKNMVYMGTSVVYGRGKAVITATGMDTEMGKIADALTKAQNDETPLQIKLNQLSKMLSFLVLGICVIIFVLGVIRTIPNVTFDSLLSTFMVAVSLAVAAIPEGLAAVVTIVLSIGVTKMSKQSAVIRKLTAVETLGCTQIICSDKTGTLTQNKMTVVRASEGNAELLATAMAQASDAELDVPDSNGKRNAIGEPTECALVNYAYSLDLDKDDLKRVAPRIGEAPFDSNRKMMSTVHMYDNGKIVQFTKGAPDEILKCCVSYVDNGKIVPLTDEKRSEILKENKDMADQALRVLAAAMKKYESKPESFEPADLEKDLCFIGLCGMIDPIRPEVKDAIAECREAGIRPIMITGDHKDTAVAIAKQLGILGENDTAITGADLNKISDEEFKKTVDRYSVYARVQPEHKTRIVEAWKDRGCIVAMTGDGVNDAPSIKTADIGVGMGITGTDVTKNVADMVLADDNFATIVTAVEEGRRIYDNIRKAIQFLLSSNLAEVISIFIATLLNFTILKPVHLLWINLITDCFPALALGMEKAEKDNMKKPPRDSKEGIFAGGMMFNIVFQGAVIAMLTLAAYFVGHFIESGVWEITESPDGMTMSFLVLSMTEIFHAFNMRSQKESVFKLTNQNLFLWGAGVLSLILTTTVIYVPFLADAFGFEMISLLEYFTALGIAALMIPIVEIQKLIARTVDRKKANK